MAERSAAFWARVEIPADEQQCWPWSGYINPDGYGRLGQVGAHRIAYEEVVGPIPEGLVLDHLCRVRHCVNPAHLEPVTSRENTLRGETLAAMQVARTSCIKGHPFDDANTIVQGDGKRRCRTCRNAVALRRYHRKRRAA